MSTIHTGLQGANIVTGPQINTVNPTHMESAIVQNPALNLKIISAKKKSEYVIQNLRLSARFASLSSLKEEVMSRCDGKASVDGGFGYIEPGHGVKGRQR